MENRSKPLENQIFTCYNQKYEYRVKEASLFFLPQELRKKVLC